MLTKQMRELERQADVIEETNYWTKRYNNLPDYIVVGKDMDGITGYTVIHKKDETQYRSGCYHSSITNGLSMSKLEMQKLADKMNKKK
jgi:hypothetical protein